MWSFGQQLQEDKAKKAAEAEAREDEEENDKEEAERPYLEAMQEKVKTILEQNEIDMSAEIERNGAVKHDQAEPIKNKEA